MAKDKKVSEAVKKLSATVKEVRRHANLFHNKVPTYKKRFRMYLCEGFAVFITQLRDATEDLVNKHELGIKESVVVSFAVVDELLKPLET